MRRARWRGFYFITDSGLSRNGILEDTRQALKAGAVLVQYREKALSFEARLAEARSVQALCRAAGRPFILNDEVELALAVEAEGLHVGQTDTEALVARQRLGKKAILGVSVGSPEEARAAEVAGASYLAASPVFATPTKPDAPEPVGLEGLRAIREVTELPLVAIGGVSETNAAALIEAGADMLCAISASLAEGRVDENIQRLLIAAGFRGEP